MSASPTSRLEPRPLRRDAASNRQHLLDAAASVFVEEGLDGSVEEVARLAGVGMGTLYRHFPTKEALVRELVDELFAEVLDVIDDAAGEAEGTGLESCVWRIAELQATHRGCQLRLWMREGIGDYEQHVERARLRLGDLLRQAQAAGRIRSDVTREDVSLVLTTISALIEQTVSTAPDAWRRCLELLLQGLRIP